MMIPVRCFTCGKVIGDKWEAFNNRITDGEDVGKVLDDLDINRYCCRRMFISHVDVLDELLKYTKPPENKENSMT